MRRTVGVVLCGVLLAGCATSHPTQRPATPEATVTVTAPASPSSSPSVAESVVPLAVTSSSGFPNPVDLVTKAGAKPSNGAVNGTMGVTGTFKFAQGVYPSYEGVVVKTFETSDALSSELAAGEQGGPQDGRAVIVVSDPLAVVYVTAAAGQAFAPAPADIARAVGGVVQRP